MDNVVNIKRWGNSQGIMLSKKLLSSIGIDDPLNQEVTIKTEDNKIILEKKKDQSRLMQHFGYLVNEPNVGEVDWGDDVGKEVL